MSGAPQNMDPEDIEVLDELKKQSELEEMEQELEDLVNDPHRVTVLGELEKTENIEKQNALDDVEILEELASDLETAQFVDDEPEIVREDPSFQSPEPEIEAEEIDLDDLEIDKPTSEAEQKKTQSEMEMEEADSQMAQQMPVAKNASSSNEASQDEAGLQYRATTYKIGYYLGKFLFGPAAKLGIGTAKLAGRGSVALAKGVGWLGMKSGGLAWKGAKAAWNKLTGSSSDNSAQLEKQDEIEEINQDKMDDILTNIEKEHGKDIKNIVEMSLDEDKENLSEIKDLDMDEVEAKAKEQVSKTIEEEHGKDMKNVVEMALDLSESKEINMDEVAKAAKDEVELAKPMKPVREPISLDELFIESGLATAPKEKPKIDLNDLIKDADELVRAKEERAM